MRILAAVALLGTVAGCEQPSKPAIPGLAELPGYPAAAALRLNGGVGTPDATPPPQIVYGSVPPIASGGAAAAIEPHEFSLDFADTDVREVVSQVLGTLLKVNYTIDPAVRGAVTLRTTQPLSRSQLLPALQSLLAQTGAALVKAGDLYRVVPAGQAVVAAGSDATAGSIIVPLRYAAAEELTRILQPFVGDGGKLVADPGRNAILVAGEPQSRESLISLVKALDADILSRQSYALLPVTTGDAQDFATALQDAFRGQTGGALAGIVRVVALPRVSAVLVISSQPRYIEEARKIYALVDRARRETIRSWHVYYLQNSHAEDMAYTLQQAFTPNNVTAQPSNQINGRAFAAPRAGSTIGGAGGTLGSDPSSLRSGIGGGLSQGGLTGGSGGLSGQGGTQGGSAGGQPGPSPTGAGSLVTQPNSANPTNPLLGGLDSGNLEVNTDTLRIIPNPQNNALLIYGTQREASTIEAMLRKIDIIPLQVRIDAVIAEVTLNDNLQYGTQFFFKSGGINGILSNATQAVTGNLSTSPFNITYPGFVLGGSGSGGAPFALSALQAVTTVNVLSSPQLLVLDNQMARLQVGDVVPYLSQTSQSTLTSGAPVVNSINYQQTGVIMEVTPRVNSGGLVTLDIMQDVSGVLSTLTTPGITSPTFSERNVASRVVVQDGQTIGLAGLITDTVTRGNQGLPWLKDVPVLGLLAGSQNNTRQRTELLVLITPHVVHDQRDARALTEDLREQLINAAAVPGDLNGLRPSGAPDPGAPLRQKLQPQQ